ncbi:MAG: helix-turn-helix transcriptional regulator [Ruminococcaceae bacterium]|nr:helix-turn-helix transcriptional regulator [Oscillospiraceae bacterium]
MSKEVSFKNRDRLIQLGVVITSLRRLRGMSQEELAEKAEISRSMLALIESPNVVQGFSLEVFYNIADALDVQPEDLINASMFADKVLKKK